ncbi:CD276 antigen-like [Seriola lalandi dorsalis]|uniref:CD276 antigen-like n=1 Tax=Seriola lalandi dorsalis TaxID=1841481 RepID=UPI000C6FA141|nr:CD276 antigen-like [Seriola lalandi dorsalis]
MAFKSNRQYFLNPRLSLVALVWLCAIYVTESATPIHIRGEVGGNVTFHCPDEKKEDVQFFYFQTNDTFVNGYYDSKDLRTYGPIWENTRVDHNEKTVDMYRLNISHSRVYECIIQYKDGSLSTKSISLSVTANYSKPTVTKSCEDGSSCLVTCVSYGGYPGTEVMWNIPVSENTSGQLWKVVNNSEVPNPSTMMYNSFSTAYFNCSKGELTYLSCSVGDVTSDMFSVCKPKVVHGIYNPVIITAICAVVAFVISIVALLLWRKYKKRPTGALAVDVKHGQSVKEEEIALSIKEEGERHPEC